MIIIFIVLDLNDFNKLKKRNSEIFKKLFIEYKDVIYNFILIKTKGNYTAAEELLSDTFHSAFVSAPSLKTNENLKSWLYTIAQRRIYDYYRKLKKNRIRIDEIKDNKRLEEDENLYNPSKLVENKEMVLISNIAMEKIRKNYKKVLEMKYKEQKSVKEMATYFNKSFSSVESMLHRARCALKKKMQLIYNEEQVSIKG